MKKQLLLIGGGVMQLPVIDIAHSMGLRVLCLDGNSRALGRDKADFFEVVDIKDKDLCLSAARKHAELHGLNGVVTVGTDFSTTVAWIAERLGLPGIPYQNALKAKDKGLMREAFREAGVPSPQFVVLDQSPQDLPAFNFDFPVVVKPADNMGARGVQLATDRQECLKAIQDAFVHSPSSRVLVEEYIDGPEFSLDAIVRDGVLHRMGFADRTIVFPPYFVEIGHTFPSRFSSEVEESVWNVFEKGVNALGITHGAAKGDVKFSSHGPMIGEIAARLSGGYMSGWTYPFSSGRSAIRWAIENALGVPLSPQIEEQRKPVVERALISLPGRIENISNVEAARAVKGVREIFLTVSEGQEMVLPQNNVEKAGNVLCVGSTPEEAEGTARIARNQIFLRLTVPHKKTEDHFWKSKKTPWWFVAAEPFELHIDPKALFEKGYDQVFNVKADWLKWGEQTKATDLYGNSVDQLVGLLSTQDKVKVNSVPVFWYFLLKGGIQGARYFLEGYERRLWPFSKT